MKIVHGIKGFKRPFAGSVVTIGVFDGVHVGHVKVIKEVVAHARAKSLKGIVVTFDPHPVKAIRKKAYVPRLISLAHRLKLIEGLGIDIAVVIKFTRTFSRMSPDRFIRQVLVNKLNARGIFVSSKFYFGKGGRSGVGELKKLAAPYHIKANIIAPAREGGVTVGSSLIRRLILAGDLNKASRCLGRPVSILGTVVRGSRLGRMLGYPTANINPHHEIVPPSGVYAVRIKVKGKLYNGVLNIGSRPTFYAPRDAEPTIESHIFNFNGTIYGSDVEVYFVKKIRDEVRYKDKAELVIQIEKDTCRARNILS